METKPLAPKDVVGWLFTESAKDLLIKNINNRLKFPEVTDDRKIKVVINRNDATRSTGIRMSDSILLTKIKEIYTDWDVSFEEFEDTDFRGESYTEYRYVFKSKAPVFS